MLLSPCVQWNICAAAPSGPPSPLPCLSSLAASESESPSESECEAADPEAESESEPDPEPDDESLLLPYSAKLQAGHIRLTHEMATYEQPHTAGVLTSLATS